MKIFKIIMLISMAGLWGSFQIKLFPVKEFGYLYIFTLIIGGYIIGYLGGKFLLKD